MNTHWVLKSLLEELSVIEGSLKNRYGIFKKTLNGSLGYN